VADNCTDRTAQVARSIFPVLSLTVHERHDESKRGKGYTIEWLLERISSLSGYDAYLMLDGDWTVAVNLLDAANAYLQGGAALLQVWCRVADAQVSWVTGLRSVAFALVNYL
jgi:hypothetical protein